MSLDLLTVCVLAATQMILAAAVFVVAKNLRTAINGLWRALFAMSDDPIGLMNAIGAAAPVRAAAPDIDNPSERREAT